MTRYSVPPAVAWPRRDFPGIPWEVTMRASRMFALLMFLVSGGAVIGQEKVDNPEFAGWVKFKKGARVTLKSVIVSDGLETEMVQIVTLLDLTADKAVLELKGMTKTVAKEYKIEPATIDVLRQVPLPPGVKPEEFANKPPGFVKGGTETVKLAAGEFKTKWFETERKFDGTQGQILGGGRRTGRRRQIRNNGDWGDEADDQDRVGRSEEAVSH